MNPHTPIDLAALTAAGVDPDSIQTRERTVHCAVCRMMTANLSAHCDRHYVEPGAVTRARLVGAAS